MFMVRDSVLEPCLGEMDAEILVFTRISV